MKRMKLGYDCLSKFHQRFSTRYSGTSGIGACGKQEGHTPIPRLSLFPRFQKFICMEKMFSRIPGFPDSRGSTVILTFSLERQILRQFVIVIVKSLLCTTCQDTECLHVNAAQLSIDDESFQEVKAIYCDGLDYYFLTDNSVKLIEDSIIHSFNCKVTHVLVTVLFQYSTSFSY